MIDKDETGGPAFPTVAGQIVYSHGMLLRDYFAAHAPEMTHQWTRETLSKGGDWLDAQASFAYAYADAMMKERSK